MELSDKIQFALLVVTALTAIISIIISWVTLRQNKKMIEESSKANIVFYIEHIRYSNKCFLTLKNFGNSVGKLLAMQITPNLDYSKIPGYDSEFPLLTDSKNVLLAPNQKISSWFSFANYPDKTFNIEIKFETLGKVYKNTYTINLNYSQSIESLSHFSFDDTDNTNKQVLYYINDSIQELVEKL